MTDPQFTQLLGALGAIAANSKGVYTLVGAADFPILVLLLGTLMGFVNYVWRDLRSEIRGRRAEDLDKCKDCKAERTKATDDLWQAMKDCQDDCCPKRVPGP